MDKVDGDSVTPEYSGLLQGTAVFTSSHKSWKDAIRYKALLFHSEFEKDASIGYKIVWYLWSADIWFGKFPLLKFIVGVNVVIWIVWLLLLI